MHPNVVWMIWGKISLVVPSNYTTTGWLHLPCITYFFNDAASMYDYIGLNDRMISEH